MDADLFREPGTIAQRELPDRAPLLNERRSPQFFIPGPVNAMSAYANGWHGVPIEASDEQQTGRLLEEDNEEWRPMPPVPFGLLPKSPCNAYAAIALPGPKVRVATGRRNAAPALQPA
jgi:hypothetical protein